MPPRALVSPALALVATLALLASCSSDAPRVQAAAVTKSSKPVSRTPTPAVAARDYKPPTQAPVRVPVTSPDKTKAGIFVLVWFETLNFGYASGDADPLRQVTALGCFTCANWVIEVQTQANKKLSRTGGFVHVRDLVYVGPDKDDYVFRAVLTREPGVLTASDGTTATVEASSGEVVELRVGLSTSAITNANSWTMKAVTIPSS